MRILCVLHMLHTPRVVRVCGAIPTLSWTLAPVAASNPHALIEAEEDPCLEKPDALVEAAGPGGARRKHSVDEQMPTLLSAMCARLGGAWGANLAAAKNTMAAALANRSRQQFREPKR